MPCTFKVGVTGRLRTQNIAELSEGFWIILSEPFERIQSTSIEDPEGDACCAEPSEA